MGCLAGAYARLGFDALGDEAFQALVLGRIIEPTSKADTLRVLADVGVPAPSLRTVFRTLWRCVDRDYRDTLAKACLAHSARTAAGQASLVLYDATTLCFETKTEDKLRRVEMSTERRVDPQRSGCWSTRPGSHSRCTASRATRPSATRGRMR